MKLILEKIFAALFLVAIFVGIWYFHKIPQYAIDSALFPPAEPEFSQFVASVADGSSDLRGVYVPNEFAFPVLSPWNDNPREYEDNLVFQHPGLPAWFLVAHNGLAGTHFYNLKIGEEVRLVFGDGSVKSYLITQIKQFQVVTTADNEYFIDVANPGDQKNWPEFIEAYLSTDEVIFETCMSRAGDPGWGRLVVFATKSQ